MVALKVVRSKIDPAVEMARATMELRVAREVAERAQEALEEAQFAVLTLMTRAGVKSSTVVMEDGRFRLTAVYGERLEVNEPSLRKALTAPVFDRLCELKLNRSKLEMAIAEGRVDPVVVASHTFHRPNKPYVKLTEIKGSEK
jgi:hypothetical protein